MRKHKIFANAIIGVGVALFLVLASSAADAAQDPSTGLLQTRADDALLKQLAQMEQELRSDPSLPEAEQTLQRLAQSSDERLRQLIEEATKNYGETLTKWNKLDEAVQLRPGITEDWLSRRAAFTLASTCTTDGRDVKESAARSGESTTMLSQRLQSARSEVAHQLGVWARLIRETEQELQRRRTTSAASNARQPTAEATQGGLRLRASQSTIELTSGETQQVWFRIESGRPPYQITAYTYPGSRLGLDLTLRKAQPFVVPVRRSTVGQYTLHLNAADQLGDAQQVSVRLNVSDNSSTPGEDSPPRSAGENGQEESPSNPQLPPKPPSQPQEPLTPPPSGLPKPPRARANMPSGHFQARLWNASSAPGWLKYDDDVLYVPVVLSIDSTGTIRGQANYDVPPKLFNPGWAEIRTEISQNVRFDLEGFTDPKTGRTTIHLKEGRRLQRHLQIRGMRRYENRKEFNSTFHGWRVPSPSDDMLLSNPVVIEMRRSGRAQQQKNFPNLGEDREGRPVFIQQGFFNHLGIDRQYDPGTHRITKIMNYWQDAKESGEIDDLKSSGPTSNPVAAWFLEILAPIDSIVDRELLALAICPRSPVRMTTERIELTAHAVYSDNVFKAVDVTNKATWRQTSGLRGAVGGSGNVEKGRYRITESGLDPQGRPRSQYVRAGILEGSDWVADTVKVVPAPAKVPVGEQSESAK